MYQMNYKFSEQLDSLRSLANVVAQRHIFCGVHTQGGYDTKFELCQNFCTMHLPPSFILCLVVQKLSCWQTNKQTNKHTLLKTSNALHYAMMLGNKGLEATYRLVKQWLKQ